MTLYEMKNFVD